MSNSIVDSASRRLKSLKLYKDHSPGYLASLDKLVSLEKEAVYKPFNPDLQDIVRSVTDNNLLHRYPACYIEELKSELSLYFGLCALNPNTITLHQSIFEFYEILFDLFLQKDQKVLLYTEDDYLYSQESFYINSGKIVMESINPVVRYFEDIIPFISTDDYKIVVICSNYLNEDQVKDFLDLVPDNVVVVFRSSDSEMFNFINFGTKTVLVLREFPAITTIVEPPIAMVAARTEVTELINRLMPPDNLDIITVFIARYFAGLDNPSKCTSRTYARKSKSYPELLNLIVRENIESVNSSDPFISSLNELKNASISFKDCADLYTGSHFMGLSEDLKNSVRQFTDAQTRYNYYTQRTLLRSAIATRISRDTASFNHGNIAIGAGVTGLIETIARAFISDGEGFRKLFKEKILLWDYSPDSYSRIICKKDAIVDYISLNSDFSLNLAAFIEKIQIIRPKLVIIDNPRILTGGYIDKLALIEFLSGIPPETLVVIDESLAEFAGNECEDYLSAIDLVKNFNNLIVLRTFSFVHALAGLRLGYAVAQDNIIDSLESVRHPFDVSPFPIHLGINIFEGSMVFEQASIKYIAEQKDYIYRELSKLGIFYIKSSTNTILFSTNLPAYDLVKRLLAEKVVIKPVRDNFACVLAGDHRTNEAFIRALKKVLSVASHN